MYFFVFVLSLCFRLGLLAEFFSDLLFEFLFVRLKPLLSEPV